MAITIDNTVKTLYFSRNQIPFVFNCPDAITTAGVAESITVEIDFTIANDGELVFTWSFGGVDYTATLTFKTTPDADLYEILVDTPDLDYINDTLIPGLYGHPDLAEFFDFEPYVAGEVTGFKITARPPYIAPLTLAIEHDASAVTEAASTTGVLEVKESDYLASAWLLMGSAHDTIIGQMDRIGELELHPDAAQQADVQIQELVDAQFTTPETPTATTGSAVLCTEITRPFALLYGQKFGDPQARKKQFLTDVLTAVKGGIRHNDWQPLTMPSWIRGRFLTLRERREVFADQKDWLFWHHQISSMGGWDVTLRADVYYNNGSSESANLWVDTAGDMDLGKSYQMQAGFIESGVKAIADAAAPLQCVYYDLYIVLKDPADVTTTDITSKVRFIIKPSNALRVVFEYENTMAGIESWAMIGERALTGAVSAETYRAPLPALADANFQDLLSFNEQDQPTITFNTGAMSRSDALAFADFMRARHKYIRAGAKRIPIQIPPGKYDLDAQNHEADYSRNMQFTAILPPSLGVSNLNNHWA